MVSSDVIDYVKEQVKAGYSSDEIRIALTTQGWNEEEIEHAMSLAGAPAPHQPGTQPGVYPPVKMHKGGKAGFILSLIGGILVFVFGLETILELQLITFHIVNAGLVIDLFGLFRPFLLSDVNVGSVVLIFAIIMMLGGLLINRSGKAKVGGVLILIFSVLTLIGFNGFLLFIGSILGIVGGILGLRQD